MDKITKSVLTKTENARNLPKGANLGKGREQTEGEYASMEINFKRNYNAISPNGDTLELSEAGRSLGGQTETEHLSLFGRSSIAGSGKKIPDVALTGYSKGKLKQLYVSKKITKQQYENMLKKIK